MKRVACNPRDRMTYILRIKVKSNRRIHKANNAILEVLIRKRIQLIKLALVVNHLEKYISIK